MLKHNKKRNSYIIYEQFISLISRLSFAKFVNEAKFITSVLKDSYHKDSLLAKEKKLFESILGTKNLSRKDSESVLSECLSESKNIDSAKLDTEKDKLISIISSKISNKFFDIPVKEYKLLASVQILFNESRTPDKQSTTPNERAKIKKILTERMSRSEAVQKDYKIDNFTYNILVEKYNNKYSKLMSNDQKEVLNGWLMYNVTKNDKDFNKILVEKKKSVKTVLGISLMSDKIKKDESYKQIKEAYEKIDSLPEKNLTEDQLYIYMKYVDLKEDVEGILNGQ